MRRCAVVRVLLPGLWMLLLVPAVAQQRRLPSDPALEPLRHEDLVVWVISHQPKPVTKTVALPQTSPEQTAGSFGQTSSSVGATSSSVGQTAGSFGRTSSSAGATSSSVGQTAGSFGVSGSQLSQAGANLPGTPQRSSELKRDAGWSRVGYRALYASIHYIDVGDGALAERLEATAGTVDAPDVLVGNPLPMEWSAQDTGLALRYGATMLGDGVRVMQTERGARRELRAEVAILRQARHPAAAGAYVVWLRDMGGCMGCLVGAPETDAPVETAERVLRSVLSGQAPGGDADPEMVKFDALAAARIALGVSVEFPPSAIGEMKIDIALTDVQMNQHLALVQLRGVVRNSTAFGVIHALAVLRPDDAGHWRVLQLTPNLDEELIHEAYSMLESYAAVPRPDRKIMTEAVGVSLAAPLDGDNRQLRPELWWDNAGGATMQVVEWQVCHRVCSGTNLYLVPDTDARLHTRVVALFAETPGRYRWRVWSMAPGGTMVLSPWRSMNIYYQ